MNIIAKIYDYLRCHTPFMWGSLVVCFSLLLALLVSLSYSEDINDFLPLDGEEHEAMEIYQSVSGADRLFVIFSNLGDPDTTIKAIDSFVDELKMRDTEGWCRDLVAEVDMSQVQQLTEYVYANIPYFLTDEDYERMEAQLSQPNYVDDRLQQNIEMLMFPTAGMLTSSISYDPLALFTPVLSQLQRSNQQMVFEIYDAHIFTPDMSRAIVMLRSEFGGSETENNAKLVELIRDVIGSCKERFEGIEAHVVGGPDIAVGNAQRIKHDSIIAISLSVLLIIVLAIFTIGSLRNILLIFLSIGWGWLFAMGGMALFSSEVSIIVIGISSVILGIAVNYPLHFISHLSHGATIRDTIRQIVPPLVIGNITTVGAFLTLVPLHSVALRDLGLFASLLLAGTILFVLIYLPHMAKSSVVAESRSKLFDRIAAMSPERSKIVVGAVVVLTLILGFFSTRCEFDSNLANCNYMTDEQRADMRYFSELMAAGGEAQGSTLYVVSSGATYDEALQKNRGVVSTIDSLKTAGLIETHSGVHQFVVSGDEQERRLKRWQEFTATYRTQLVDELTSKASKYGFAPDAFSKFEDVVNFDNESQMTSGDVEGYLSSTLFAQNMVCSVDRGRCYVVDYVGVDSANIDKVKACFDLCFDSQSMQSSLTRNLSDNFNYIGIACSVIVFLFLWFSFGRLELAIISFLPMAISWIWILGLMAIFGIKFNIVNIILATFIFGQGDDYTIFITEGCQSEYAYGRKVLASYKRGILQSALIMFVGIGTLIISQHPAMRSLAEVTIVGMFCVVLMAYMLPPLLFRWLTTTHGKLREHPITLRTLLCGYPHDLKARVRGRYMYKGVVIMRAVNKNLRALDTQHCGVEGVDACYHIEDKGYGEQALMIALSNPDVRVVAHIDDDHRRRVAQIAAEGFATNLEII